MLWGIVLSFIATGVVADSISLFNPDPGAPISAYEAGVTNGVTTYLLGCNASAAATGACDFTQPLTLVEGSKTFHVEITKPLSDGYTQTLTVDCPAGTTGACSVTALNTIHQTTTISLAAANFSGGIVALPTAASAQALLYNGIPLPTASATTTLSYPTNGTSTSSPSYTPSATGGATYGNSTVKGSLTPGGPSLTSSPVAPSGKSGAVSGLVGAWELGFAGLVAVVFLAGNL